MNNVKLNNNRITKLKNSEKLIYDQFNKKSILMPDNSFINRMLEYSDIWIEERLFNFLRGSRILDVGCGTGSKLIKFAKKSYKVVGVDLSYNLVNLAKQNFIKTKISGNLIVGDVEHMMFKDQSFDVIYCKAILHHLPNIKKDLMEFSRLLKPNGIILVTEPALLNPIAFFRRKIFPSSIHTPDEHPFIPYKFIHTFKEIFINVEVKHFFLFSLLAPILYKVAGNYAIGKKISKIFLHIILPIDRIIMRFPFICQFCWIFTAKGSKKSHNY